MFGLARHMERGEQSTQNLSLSKERPFLYLLLRYKSGMSATQQKENKKVVSNITFSRTYIVYARNMIVLGVSIICSNNTSHLERDPLELRNKNYLCMPGKNNISKPKGNSKVKIAIAAKGLIH